jgi:hypothetical protein
MKDGGPAFPAQPTYKMPHGVEMVVEQSGMSLRDWFAGMALQGVLASMADPQQRRRAEQKGETPKDLAIARYHVADAMLAEREKSA